MPAAVHRWTAEGACGFEQLSETLRLADKARVALSRLRCGLSWASSTINRDGHINAPVHAAERISIPLEEFKIFALKFAGDTPQLQ